MAENTKVRSLTDEQIAKLKKTAGANLVEAEELLKKATEAKKKFDGLFRNIYTEYQALKRLYPDLNIGLVVPENKVWYQDLVKDIKDLEAAINAAKDNNAYKHVTNIEEFNEQTEQAIKDIMAICEEIVNNPLLKESIANGVQ